MSKEIRYDVIRLNVFSLESVKMFCRIFRIFFLPVANINMNWRLDFFVEKG